jgi:hypothetical protein
MNAVTFPIDITLPVTVEYSVEPADRVTGQPPMRVIERVLLDGLVDITPVVQQRGLIDWLEACVAEQIEDARREAEEERAA